MNKMFKKKNGRKIKKLNMNTHKAMRISDLVFQTNKTLFVTFNPRNSCKLELSYHLWLLFFDKPQSDVVLF